MLMSSHVLEHIDVKRNAMAITITMQEDTALYEAFL